MEQTEHVELAGWLAGNKSRRFELRLEGSIVEGRLTQKANAAQASFEMVTKRQSGETTAEMVARAVKLWRKEVEEGLGY